MVQKLRPLWPLQQLSGIDDKISRRLSPSTVESLVIFNGIVAARSNTLAKITVYVQYWRMKTQNGPVLLLVQDAHFT